MDKCHENSKHVPRLRKNDSNLISLFDFPQHNYNGLYCKYNQTSHSVVNMCTMPCGQHDSLLDKEL